MIELSLTDLLKITGGEASATVASDTLITSVTTDSREVTSGRLFVAKPGEFSDGHAFIDRALASGAVLALAERLTYDDARNVHPAIIVDDAVEAMGKIMRSHCSVPESQKRRQGGWHYRFGRKNYHQGLASVDPFGRGTDGITHRLLQR